MSSNGGLIFNECILTTYIALDALIASARLTSKQRAVLDLLMRGYTIQDIADVCDRSKQSISNIFSRALDSLVEANEQRWKDVVTTSK